MKMHSNIQQSSFRSVLLCWTIAFLFLPRFSTQSQTIFNVTNFGAVGDAVQLYVNTIANSVVVTTSNRLSSADIGKTIEIFGVGTQSMGLN